MLISAALFLVGAGINAAGIQAAKAPQGGRVVSADPLWRKCRHVTPATGAAANGPGNQPITGASPG